MDDLDWDKGTRLLCNTSVASSSIGVNKPGMKHHSFVSNIMDQKETSADEHDSSRSYRWYTPAPLVLSSRMS